MKKLKKIIVSVLAMTLLMSVSAFAATPTDAATIAEVTKQLTDAGVQQVYVDAVSDYLEENTITTAQKDEMMAVAQEIKALVGDTPVSELTSDQKTDIGIKANEAAGIIGLNIMVSIDQTFVEIREGTNTIATLTQDEALAQYTALEGKGAAVEAALQLAIDGYVAPVVTPGTTTTTPSTTTTTPATTATAMKKTGTNNGNVLALGFGVLALAGAAFAVSKKVTA